MLRFVFVTATYKATHRDAIDMYVVTLIFSPPFYVINANLSTLDSKVTTINSDLSPLLIGKTPLKTIENEKITDYFMNSGDGFNIAWCQRASDNPVSNAMAFVLGVTSGAYGIIYYFGTGAIYKNTCYAGSWGTWTKVV
jgi:hypothetical protein